MKALPYLAIALLLAGCEKELDPAVLNKALDEVTAAAREVAYCRDKANAPGATVAHGVEYKGALDALAAAEKAAREAGANDLDVTSRLALGKAQGERVAANVRETMRRISQ